MASFKTLGSGSIRAFVCVNGMRDNRTFKTKKKAASWAKLREVELSKLEGIRDDSMTFYDLFERYAEEISPGKEGAHWEQLRLRLFMRNYTALCLTKLCRSTKEDFDAWIAERSQTVASLRVNRELNIISHCLTVAKEDWKWMSHETMKGLKRPKSPPHRNRRIPETEIQTLCHALGYHEQAELSLKREFVAVAFLFAIETAMRAGEICSLTRSNINFETKVAHLLKTKNGDGRGVPLSDRAIELIHKLPIAGDEQPLFQLNARSLSTSFREHKLKTTIEDIAFHDSRHEATTRLSSKLHVLALASVAGHRVIKELMTYYSESAEDIALKLNSRQTNAKTEGLVNDANVAALAQQLLRQLAQAANKKCYTSMIDAAKAAEKNKRRWQLFSITPDYWLSIQSLHPHTIVGDRAYRTWLAPA